MNILTETPAHKFTDKSIQQRCHENTDYSNFYCELSIKDDPAQEKQYIHMYFLLSFSFPTDYSTPNTCKSQEKQHSKIECRLKSLCNLNANSNAFLPYYNKEAPNPCMSSSISLSDSM